MCTSEAREATQTSGGGMPGGVLGFYRSQVQAQGRDLPDVAGAAQPPLAPRTSLPAPARQVSEATQQAQAGKQIQPTAKRGTMSPVNKGTAQIKAGNA